MARLTDERDLDLRLGRLEAARTWSPRVVSRLEALIRDGEDAQLFRVNPFTFAKERDIEPGEAVDLLLHATAQALFEMDWLVICPRCACAVESFTRLRAVQRRFRCPECNNHYEAAMDDFIAIYFTISAQVRTIRYHRPESLEPFDYLYHYRGVREGRTHDDRPFIEASREALRALTFVGPGETVRLEIEAGPGLLWSFSADTDARFCLEVGDVPASAPQRLRLTCEVGSYSPDRATVAPGPITLEVTNATADRQVLAIAQYGHHEEDRLLTFEPYLAGKHLLTSQTFKSLFRSEVVGGAQGLAIRDIAFLFTDIKGSTALYREIGDLNAFQLVQQHFDWLREATVRHGGAVVKTIGDAVMAAYPDAARAVAAALDMRSAVERHDQAERPIMLKIGIHHGAAIAVTMNDELDYFGQTVNIAARVQALAEAAEICVTGEVWAYPGVRELLAPYIVQRSASELRGVAGAVAVVRIGSGGQRPC